MSQQALDPTIKKFYDVRRSNSKQPLFPDVKREDGTLFHKKEPTVTVLLSGGGIRAMESSVHFIDFLKRDAILDNVQTVGGLSGGSWACIVGGMAGERSHFHERTDAHPWSRGSNGTDVRDVLTNDNPLVKMLSPENAEAARAAVIRGSPGPYRKTLVWSDIVIAILKLFDGLLAEQGFSQKDIRDLFGTITGDRRYSTLMNFATMLGYQLLGEERDDKHHQLIQQSTENDLPLFLAAAVEQNTNDNEKFQWFAFDGLDAFTPTAGAVRGLDPFSTEEAGQDQSIPRTTETVYCDFDLTAHRVIGICGSALGMFKSKMKLLDGEGFRAQINKAATKEHFAELVDAGIHNNVPFPLALKGSHELEEHNIAIVLDNSYGADGPAELLNAVKQGYFHPMCSEDELKKPFFPNLDDDHLPPTVKIFFPDEEHQATEPIIIYAMGDVKEFTSRFDRELHEINTNRNFIQRVAGLVTRGLEQLLQLTPEGIKSSGGVIDIKRPLHDGTDDAMPFGPESGQVLVLDWQAFETLFDAMVEIEKLYLQKHTSTSADQLRTQAIRLGLIEDSDAPEIKTAAATKKNITADGVYQAFAWAASAVGALEKDEQLTDEVVAELASWLKFSSLEREQKVQYALFFFATKVQMLAASSDSLKPKAVELLQAFKEDFAARIRAAAAAKSITVTADATTAEDVMSEVAKFVENAPEKTGELTYFAAALQKRLDIYGDISDGFKADEEQTQLHHVVQHYK